jgi:hypothetical protein
MKQLPKKGKDLCIRGGEGFEPQITYYRQVLVAAGCVEEVALSVRVAIVAFPSEQDRPRSTIGLGIRALNACAWALDYHPARWTNAIAGAVLEVV